MYQPSPLFKFIFLAIAFLCATPFMFEREIKDTYILMNNEKRDIYEMSAEDFAKDQAVYGDLYFTYGWVAEEYRTDENGNRTYAPKDTRYYLIPVGLDEYMVVCVQRENFPAMEKLTEQSYSYYFEDGDEEPELLHIEGRTEPLDDWVREYMREWFADSDFFGTSDAAEIDRYIVPYTITYANWEKSKGTAIAAGIFFMVLLTGTIVVIIIEIRHKRAMKKPVTNKFYDSKDYTGGEKPVRWDKRYSFEGIRQKAKYTPTDEADSVYDENQKPPCEL